MRDGKSRVRHGGVGLSHWGRGARLRVRPRAAGCASSWRPGAVNLAMRPGRRDGFLLPRRSPVGSVPYKGASRSSLMGHTGERKFTSERATFQGNMMNTVRSVYASSIRTSHDSRTQTT